MNSGFQIQQPVIKAQPVFYAQQGGENVSKMSQSQLMTQSQAQNITAQQSRAQSFPTQNQQKQLDGSIASTQKTTEGSTIGQRLKLNVSQ